jgi:hypothetical protein
MARLDAANSGFSEVRLRACHRPQERFDEWVNLALEGCVLGKV